MIAIDARMDQHAMAFRPSHRIQGWALSLILHAVLVSLAVIAVAEVTFVPDQDIFRWQVAVVQSPIQDAAPQPTAAAEPPSPAPPVSQPAPQKASPQKSTPAPRVTKRIETKPMMESVRPQPAITAAPPRDRQVVERTIEQAQPIRQTEQPQQVAPVTPHPIETPEPREHTPVVQERSSVQDKTEPLAAPTPQNIAAVPRHDPVISPVPQGSAPLMREPATKEPAMESPQPITKQVAPVEEPAPAEMKPAPVTHATTAVESPPAVARETAPIVNESPPVESRQPVETRSEPQTTIERAPSLSASAPTALSREPAAALDHSPPTQATMAPAPSPTPQPGAVAKAYATPRADFGWLTQALWRRIEQLKRYPHTARMNRWEGTVVVRCVIRPDGNFSELTMEKSSGHDVLDRDAIDLLRKASPLSLKHELGRPELTIRIPISYKLE